MYKAALFDLDGVLIDSETLYTRFWEKVGREHHLPSPTFAYDIKGTTLTDILTTYFPDPEVRKDIDRMLHEFENEIVYPVRHRYGMRCHKIETRSRTLYCRSRESRRISFGLHCV